MRSFSVLTAVLCLRDLAEGHSFGAVRHDLADLPSYKPPTGQALEAAKGHATCRELRAKHRKDVYFPDTQDYKVQITYHWDEDAVLYPHCVFAPHDAKTLADGLSIITKHKTPFGVRSGGHMPNSGAASTDDGVLIAMSNFRQVETVPTPNDFGTPYVRLGPGPSWGEIYDILAKEGVTISAGRVYSVGTSLALGGGLSYFSGDRGWACNDVVNYEIVLANSTVVQANERENPDLFWALKGGSSNFGIVTRYDFKYFEVGQVFGGSVVWDPAHYADYLAAEASFISPGGGHEDTKAAIMPNFEISLLTEKIAHGAVLLYNAPDPDPVALQNFTAIPATSGYLGVQDFTNITASTNAYATRDFRWSFYDVTLKADARSMYLINDTVISLAKQEIPGLNVSVGAAVQPVTQQHLKAARAAGGDALDLDPEDGSFIIALIYANWDDPALDPQVVRWSELAISELTKRAKAEDLHYPFIFLNDAGPGQNPFETYGKGKSLPKLQQVSKAYDPEGVFQTYTGGFKVF
ncbi:hypothetical protein AJ79_09174 [Helicocarpus griseus UAMH5409]|uniref:FAD-binding PCMH-type domain-containing protein n=1 Tax=Helicocarpus griseus UAMH5409 TaxID=1447875 RepID=A0A2B7WLH4_9EURO|nr:hypothetical protein AJ79_09174 [Helicocarpus griseus UAMH5409]